MNNTICRIMKVRDLVDFSRYKSFYFYKNTYNEDNKLKNLPSWFYKTLDEIIKIHSSKPYELNAIIEKERIKNES